VWLATTIAITTIVIAFRRFESNERIARAVAVGVVRRRGEPAATAVPTSESSPS
jgi:hypothetical protein